MSTDLQQLLNAAGISLEVYQDTLAGLILVDQLEGDTGDLAGGNRPYSMASLAAAVKNPKTQARAIAHVVKTASDVRPHALYSSAQITATLTAMAGGTLQLFSRKRGSSGVMGFTGDYDVQATNLEDDGKLPAGYKLAFNRVRCTIVDDGADAADRAANLEGLRSLMRAPLIFKFGEESKHYLGRVGQYLDQGIDLDTFEAVAADAVVPRFLPVDETRFLLPGRKAITIEPQKAFGVEIPYEAATVASGAKFTVFVQLEGILFVPVVR